MIETSRPSTILEFVDDKGVWQQKDSGIKLSDGSYDNRQMKEKMVKIIKGQVEHLKIEVL